MWMYDYFVAKPPKVEEEDDVLDLETEVELLRVCYDTLRQCCDTLRKEYQTQSEENKQLREELAQLRTEITNCQHAQKYIRDDAKEAGEELHFLSTALSSLSDDVDELRTETGHQFVEVVKTQEALRNDIVEIQKELDEIPEQVSEIVYGIVEHR